MIVVLSVLLGGILTAAPAAAAPSSVDQYLPRLDKGGVGDSQGATPYANLGGGGGTPGQAQPAAQAAKEEPAGDAGGTDIPGTSFPLTPLVALVAVGVLAALFLRFALQPLRHMAHDLRR
jgi:hypothetical protein